MSEHARTMSADTVATTRHAEVVRTVRDLEDRRFSAIVDRDYAAFAALCDERLTYTHSNGERDTLDSYVAACEAGVYEYHSVEHPVDDVVVHGDLAVVIGRMRADLSINGVRKLLDNQSLAVWIRDDGAWRFLAFQGTPIPAT